jgi:hypothetical protein
VESTLPPAAATNVPQDDVAALLREHLKSCLDSAALCFSRAANKDDLRFGFLPRDSALSTATRLVRAGTSLALAIKRLENLQDSGGVGHAKKIEKQIEV